MFFRRFFLGVGLSSWIPGFIFAAPPQSAWVGLADDGRLIHARDARGNRIPDFGNCGFRQGKEPIPAVPSVLTVSPPGAGVDATALIQNAIDRVSAMEPNADGFRGAILFEAGDYLISDTLHIAADGVILRGVGISETTGTRFRATASKQYTLISFAGTGSKSVVPGSTRDITDKYVPVGACSFTVSDASGYQAGDPVVVFRPSTASWIQSLGMHQLSGDGVVPWQPGAYDIHSERTVTRVEGNRIFIDAPITTALDAAHGGGRIWKYTWNGKRLRLCGIEKIKGLSGYDETRKSGNDFIDENHAWVFVSFQRAEDGWVKGVASRYFGNHCVSITHDSRQISVLDSISQNPVSQVTGGRRYAFNLDDSTRCLFWNCSNNNDRHQYVTGSLTTGPNAFVSSVSTSARSDAGPHHRWASGILFDRIDVSGNNINIQNRGNLGSGHGWSGANSVVWNSTANGFIVRNPPGARNWLIGSRGNIQNGSNAVGPNPAGTHDSSGPSGTNVFPSSLWANQRQDLLAVPGLTVREYVVGDYDEFTVDAGEETPVDSAWKETVSSLGTTSGFDDLSAGRYRPWTHAFTMDDGEAIVSATLFISVRGLAANAQNASICFNDTGDFQRLSDFVSSVPTTGSTGVAIDLAGRLPGLASGKLNLALGPEVAVDWSSLELRVAPVDERPAISIVSDSDGYARAVAPYADQVQDGGTSAGLVVKGIDPEQNVTRRSFFKWDLSPLDRRVVHATVRLVPLSTSNEVAENCLSVLNSNSWSEETLTWNNQPSSGQRLASWHPRAGVPVEVVVTKEVKEALAGNGWFGVSATAAVAHTSNDYITYASREHPDPALRPMLRITMVTPQESWRSEHFGTEENQGIAADDADADGDGWNNLDEYLAGTHPASVNDFPKLGIKSLSKQSFEAEIPGRAGRIYALEKSADLSEESWEEIVRSELLLMDAPVTLVDGNPPVERAFYRVRIIFPQ